MENGNNSKELVPAEEQMSIVQSINLNLIKKISELESLTIELHHINNNIQSRLYNIGDAIPLDYISKEQAIEEKIRKTFIFIEYFT